MDDLARRTPIAKSPEEQSAEEVPEPKPLKSKAKPVPKKTCVSVSEEEGDEIEEPGEAEPEKQTKKTK